MTQTPAEPANRRPPNFDRIARPYRWLEYATLGPMLELTRNQHLSRLTDRMHALVIGDGDGRFTARMMKMHPRLKVHAVDLSAGMLRLLRLRVARIGEAAAARVRTTQAHALTFEGSRREDLVVTHFLLDCLTTEEIEVLVARVVPVLAPRAMWLVSEFRVPAGWLGLPARAYVRLLYLSFRVLTGLRVSALPEWERTLAAAGFVPIAVHRRLGGMLTAELWQRN